MKKQNSSFHFSTKKVLKAYEQIADQLKEAVVSGELKPGDSLPSESEMAKRFGVGRSTIREALKVLQVAGLVNTSRGVTGSIISFPSSEAMAISLRDTFTLLLGFKSTTIDQLTEAREIIEVPCAGLAAVRRTQKDLVAMEESIPTNLGSTPWEEFVAYDAKFHKAIAKAASNEVLGLAMSSIHQVLQSLLVQTAFEKDFIELVLDQHRVILDAIKRQDPEFARTAIRDHLHLLLDYYRRDSDSP